MPKKLDITGRTFGYLTAVSPTTDRDHGNIKWLFDCVCTRRVSLASRCVTLLGQKSCGCRAHEAEQPVGIMGLIKYYRSNVKSRGLTWELSLDDARRLFFGNCHYCDSPPTLPFKYSGVTPPVTLIRNGIDRLDNTLGYVTDNTVTCCWWCNRAKGETPYAEFLDRIRRISSHRGSR